MDGDISLSRAAADALIASGDGAAALLYIYILRGGSVEPEKAAAELSLTGAQLGSALEKLRALGLTAAPAPVRPEYSAGDITETLDGDTDFKALTEDAERRLGKPLSRADLERLLYMYRQLSLPAEVLSLLIANCTAEYCELYGRAPRIGYIEKAAQEWAQMGLFSPESAEEYLEKRQQLRSKTGQAKKLLGISGRKLSPSEEKYITGWLSAGFELDALERAYDITVLRTGQLRWSYMASIMRSWQKKGLLTAKAVDEAEGTRKKAPPAEGGRKPGEHELQAMAQMREYARRRKENGGD